jgi:hypothetical protein
MVNYEFGRMWKEAGCPVPRYLHGARLEEARKTIINPI